MFDVDYLLIAEEHNSRTQMEQTLGTGMSAQLLHACRHLKEVMLAQPDQSSLVAKALLMLKCL